MAPKKPSESAPRSNKIRFVLVEADISDGNLSELTQAITSALRPAPSPVRQLPRAAAPALAPVAEVLDEPETDEPELDIEEEAAAAANGNGAAPKPARVKKFKPPSYVASIVEGDKAKSFKDFVAGKNTKSKNAKYLAAAYWLKENGDQTANADKVYTLFKTAAWSTGFNDWNQTFHNLVHTEHMRKEGNGEFALNPLGEDAVNAGTE